ncbi:hypothetical protein HG543_39175, partial [Pyxidicoccus fallax]|nr:hypothetical protein [Pyxidicoccus fallax]
MSIGQSAVARVPWVTLTLAVVLVAVHVAVTWTGPADVDALVRWGAKAGP